MFSLARSFALAGAALAASLVVACSSSSESTPSSPTSTTTTTAPAAGPLSGTYSADSVDGTAPFLAITFLDQTHYTYVAKSCFSAPAGAAADGDDSGDPVADHGATPDYDADPTDGGCIHDGTYQLTATDLTLTDDDASSAAVVLPVAELAANGTEVTDSSAASSSTSGLVGGNTLVITINIQLLFGQKSVSSLVIGGTAMRRTGLVNQAGVGSACTLGNGTHGTCRLTSTCAAEGNTSTPDYCPGPDDVQCCTTTKKGAAPGPSDNAVTRAQEWVAVKMPYCESANGAADGDGSCSSVCHRSGAADTSEWNPYRSDCSGLVSWAWDLSAPGLTTWEFVPSAATFIPTEDLQPGDAVLRPSTHVVLFDHWIDKSNGTADVISEPGCAEGVPPYAQHQTWSLGRAPSSASASNWGGATYYATRKRG